MMPTLARRRMGVTPPGFGTGAKLLANMVDGAYQREKEHHAPTASIQVSLTQVLDELRELEQLDVDWDGEDAAAIDATAIARARYVVSTIAEYVETNRYTWQRPEVAPMRSGGISLSWHLVDTLHWLIFEPNMDDVIYIYSEKHGKPTRRILAPEYAVRALVLALSNQ